MKTKSNIVIYEAACVADIEDSLTIDRHEDGDIGIEMQIDGAFAGRILLDKEGAMSLSAAIAKSFNANGEWDYDVGAAGRCVLRNGDVQVAEVVTTEDGWRAIWHSGLTSHHETLTAAKSWCERW